MESAVRLMLGDTKLLAWARYTVEVKLGARMSPEGQDLADKSWSKPVQAVVRTPPALPSRWVNISLCLMSSMDGSKSVSLGFFYRELSAAGGYNWLPAPIEEGRAASKSPH
jgi:hypothetical protein